MPVTHVSNDINHGGGTLVPVFLHRELLRQGYDSNLYVRENFKGDAEAKLFKIDTPDSRLEKAQRIIRRYLTPKLLEPYSDSRPTGLEYFSPDWSTYGQSFARQVPLHRLVHLHWVTPGFFDYQYFFRRVSESKQKVIWTCHDQNPFTGGCHYSFDCEGFQSECGTCPQLGSKKSKDLSSRVLQRKKNALTSFDLNQLTIICPSSWMARQARQSALFAEARIEVIHNGIDLSTFIPEKKNLARNQLNIPNDRRVVLFVATSASNARKGFSYLTSALNSLSRSEKKGLHFLICGSSQNIELPDLENTTQLGSVHEPSLMRSVYSAADTFIIPSTMDNLPTTAIEALACATPVIGFDCGGLRDIVTDGVNGYLIENKNVQMLSESLARLSKSPELFSAMQSAAIHTAQQKFDLVKQAEKHISLYNELGK